ncbi:MAG: alpha/beta hydrolase [Bacteroidota bacterium]|jgi:acetyl esterase
MPLDPGAQQVIDLIKSVGRPPYETVGHEEARRLYLDARRVLQPEPMPIAETRDLTAPGPAGSMAIRLYRARASKPGETQPALIYFHGGGWVIGSIDSHDGVCRGLANHAGCTVLSVDYRLAPEHKFPAAAEDCIAATEWVWENAAALGVDRNRLAVGGDSAGGNLAAVVCLNARERGTPKLRFQLLIYPACDMAMGHGSIAEFAEQLPLTRSTMKWFIDLYLRGAADVADWRASPLKASNLKSLPPAYVLTAGYDPLRDEGEAFAAALKAAGVPVEAKRYPGQIHGFLTMGKFIPEAAAATQELGAALKRALA